MLGYLFLALSLFTGLAKGFCGKKISGQVLTLKGTIYMNTLRMAICVVVGFFMSLAYGIGAFAIDFNTALISAVSGITTALFVVSWVFCVRKGAYVMIDVFLMLGNGITITMCYLIFGEAVTMNQIIGFALLVLASYIMCSYSSNIKGGFSFSSLLLLIACGAVNGLTSFAQKWFIFTEPDGNAAIFNFYTYIFAALVLLISFWIADKNEQAENDAKSLKVAMVIALMAVFLFANSYFKTLAGVYVPSALLYPITSGLSIVLSSIMASVFFKEKITSKCVVGIIVAIVAIVVMNLK